jgi:hypothetical protein
LFYGQRVVLAQAADLMLDAFDASQHAPSPASSSACPWSDACLVFTSHRKGTHDRFTGFSATGGVSTARAFNRRIAVCEPEGRRNEYFAEGLRRYATSWHGNKVCVSRHVRLHSRDRQDVREVDAA